MNCIKLICFISLFAPKTEGQASYPNDSDPNRRLAVRFQNASPNTSNSINMDCISGGLLNLARTNLSDVDLLFLLNDPRKSGVAAIDLSYTSISSNSFFKIQELSNLTSIAIRAVRIGISDLRALKGLKSITSIDLSECTGMHGDLTTEMRHHLGGLPIENIRLERLPETCPLKLESLMPDLVNKNFVFQRLKRLSVSFSFLDEESVCGLPLESLHVRNINLKRLRTNIFCKNFIFEQSPRLFTHEIEAALKNDGFVRTILISLPKGCLEGAPLKPEPQFNITVFDDYTRPTHWFHVVANAQKLTQLDISENNLRDEQISSLSLLSFLHTLHLSGNPLSHNCLKYLIHLPLRELSLRRTFLTDYKDVDILALNNKVAQRIGRKYLNLTFPKQVIKLFLDYTLIEGENLQLICLLPNLKELSLTNTPLNQNALEAIATCTHAMTITIDRKHQVPFNKLRAVLPKIKSQSTIIIFK